MNLALSDELESSRTRGSSLTRALATSQEQTLQERQRREQHCSTLDRRLDLLTDECDELRATNRSLDEQRGRDVSEASARLQAQLYAAEQRLTSEHAGHMQSADDEISRLAEEIAERAERYDDARRRYDVNETRLVADLQRGDRELQELRQLLLSTEQRAKEEAEVEAKEEAKEEISRLQRNHETLVTALNCRVDELTSANLQLSSSSSPKTLSSVEIDYEMKLGDMTEKLADATRKLSNLNRRHNRNQRCQSLDSPSASALQLASQESVSPLRRRIATLERQRLEQTTERGSLRAIVARTDYGTPLQVQDDLQLILATNPDSDDLSAVSTECFRRAYCEQLVRESLVIGKLAITGTTSTPPDHRRHLADERACLQLLHDAFSYLESRDRLDEGHELSEIATFLSGQLFLISQFSSDSSPSSPPPPPATQSSDVYTSSISILLGSRSYPDQLLLSVDTFCYRACSLLSHDYNAAMAEVLQAPSSRALPALRCRGYSVDDRLYEYVTELLVFRSALYIASLPASLRFLADEASSLDEFRASLENCDAADVLAMVAPPCGASGVVDDVRRHYDRACNAARLDRAHSDARLLQEKLEDSESLVTKLDGEIKRLWRLVDQVCFLYGDGMWNSC